MKPQKEKYKKNKKYQASFDDKTNRYSLRNHFGFYFEYRKFCESIKLFNYANMRFSHKKVLDIGSHRGFQLNNLAFLKGSSKELYGIDFIPEFTKQASAINPGLKYEVMDFYKLGFKDEYFDLVTLYYVINCMPLQDRLKILSNISNKIKPGGHILIFEHSDNLIINSIRKFVKTVKREDAEYKEYANDLLLKKYLKRFKLVKSRRVINFLSSKLCTIFPYWFVEVVDYFLPSNYYISLWQKT